MTLFAFFLFAASEKVNKCEGDDKERSHQHRPHPRPDRWQRFYRRRYIDLACAGEADDVWAALSGIAVAAFTFTLWRSTVGLWQSADLERQNAETSRRADAIRFAESLQVAKDSAEAAKLSAEAALSSAKIALGIELPRLSVIGVGNLSMSLLAPGELIKVNASIVALKNHGRTTASIIEDCAVLLVSDTLPGNPIYPTRTIKPANLGMRVDKDTYYNLHCAGRIDISGDEARRVAERQANLWLYGYVAYQDFLENHWREKFCLFFNFNPDAQHPDFTEYVEYPKYIGREKYPSEPAD